MKMARMDRRTFLVAGAGALVFAACGGKSAIDDDPGLAAATTDELPGTTATAAAPTTAAPTTLPPTTLPPTTAAPATTARPLPTPAPSPRNAHAPEPENRIGTIAIPKLGLTTALFEGVTVLFLAQVAGVELSLLSQVIVIALAVLTAIGAAGVPGGSLPLLTIVLAQVGVPPEMIALIIGTDRIVDMTRTMPNVTSDLLCSMWLAKREQRRAPGDRA